jgi:hypothetical protein
MTRTARASQHPARRARQRPPAIPAPPPADHEDEGDLDAYVKEIVDALPPLTSEQRDLLALIFRNRRRLTTRDRRYHHDSSRARTLPGARQGACARARASAHRLAAR